MPASHMPASHTPATYAINTTRRTAALLAAIVASAAPFAGATVTTLIGGSINNGNFDANDDGSASRTFDQTANWWNIGNGGQVAEATRNNLDYDGTRNASITESGSRIMTQNTGHDLADGDVFNIRYVWRDAFNWADGADEMGVTLYTTVNDTIGGARDHAVTVGSGLRQVNDAYEFVLQDNVFVAGPADVGKRLFVEIDPINNGGANTGFARVDNFELLLGAIPTPTPPAPSPLKGVNLFSDTFDRPDTVTANQDLDLDSSTAGMSSAVFTPTVNTTYSEFVGQFNQAGSEAVIEGGKMRLAYPASGQSYAGINHNFIDQQILDAGGFAIEATIDPYTGSNGTTDNRYASIGVGLDQAGATTQSTIGPNGGSDPDRQLLELAPFAFTIEDDGNYNIFDSYAKITLDANPLSEVAIVNYNEFENAVRTRHDNASQVGDGRTDLLSQLGLLTYPDEYKVRLEFSLADFNAGSVVDVIAFINDIRIDLDPSDGIEANPEDRDGYAFTWDFTNQNYIAFGGRAPTDTSFDNLMIETLIPEPASVALLAAGMLTGLRRRRRA